MPREGMREAIMILLVLCCSGCGPHLTLGGGLARGSISVSEERESAWGPVVSIRAGVPDSSVIQGLLAADLQLFRVVNPVRAEHFRTLLLVPSIQIGSPDIFLRLGLGPALYGWGGDDPAVPGVDSGFAAAMSAGAVIHTRGQPRWSVEVFGRAGGPATGEMWSGLIGIQMARYLCCRR